ncbi:MAG TPA: TatD family hydrolase [Bacteroidota bacterium]|nr:TatD family hydrolase [Bacteroidota bacterium]
MYIDSHAHLFYPDFKEDIEDVIRRAEDAGVAFFVVPATNVETSKEAIALSERHENIYVCVGIHPLDMNGADDNSLQEIEKLSEHRKVVAIGEIGLDYYYDTTPREKQQRMFKAQIEIAIRRNLPIVVHTRDSMDDAVSMAAEMIQGNEYWRSQQATPNSRFPAPKGVFHCFSGDASTARKLLRMGFLVSYPGIVTFKNSSAAETLKAIGYDHIMLETDSPYLTPAPHRGKRNEPMYVPLIGKKVAEVCSATEADVARTTTYNAKRLFNIGSLGEPVFTYSLGRSLYINLTIRCDADCVFCDRKGEAVVKGHNLKITREPTVQEIISGIKDPKSYDEVVFCGYGEPTIRFDAVKEIGSWVKANGGKTRLNTDGHGSLINKRNIAPELKGVIDTVSISLNSVDPLQYGELMRINGEKNHAAMVDFAREAKKYVPEVVMSVVGIEEVDLEGAKKYVEDVLGVKYRVRPYF